MNVIGGFLGGEKYPHTTEGRGKAELEGKGSGTPPKPEPWRQKGQTA
jgi:hypothetical protein